MQIEKKFHFYAAHRNETLVDKCFNVHGHLYRVTCIFSVTRDILNPHITQLFAQYDVIDHHLKAVWDHSMIINRSDPVGKAILEATGGVQRFVILDRPTSVENVCYELWHTITHILKFDNLACLRIQETESSTVVYTAEDYKADQKLFQEEPVPPCECVFNAKGNCIVCGGTEFQYKLRKRRDAQQATRRTTGQ